MNLELRQAYDAEMRASIDLYRQGESEAAFRHLEIAHVLGQQYVAPNVRTHYWMLKLGLKHRSLQEVWGQVLRIVLGAIGSAVGVVPSGNTGGTNISMFKRLPVDPHIRTLMGPEPHADRTR